ncbi:MAG: DNA topoisomerase I [Nitrososphaerales archaeon]
MFDSEYLLVVCEKPDAAKRIASALGSVESERFDDVVVYKVSGERGRYVVCAALGHLYTVWDVAEKKSSYPVFDVSWYPLNLVDKGKRRVGNLIKVISSLAKGAKGFVNACDYDIEGETIGYNILRYVCGGKESVALRAKFSTLTLEELREAFAKMSPNSINRLAEAGRARHVVDFLWGVNLTRALTQAYSSKGGYRTLSVGRVQGPTLAFVVERECEIRWFVPTPFWSVSALLEKDGFMFKALYVVDKVERLAEAQAIEAGCRGKEGVVKKVSKQIIRQHPPTPFNLGDLQHEAYRVFGFSPSLTLRVAESLYLKALISYPRTSSQKLPPSIGYHKIFSGLQKLEQYRVDVNDLLTKPLKPFEGEEDDPAHPAIYPTGELPQGLDDRQSRLYDLIVRRFLAVFGEYAVRERVSADVEIGSYLFRVSGRRTIEEGWMKYYRSYVSAEDNPLPLLEEGNRLKVISLDVAERFEQPPPRYNQSSLLAKMEKEGIGTKATRAEIIDTLYQRGYIVGSSIRATDIAFSVIEVMKEYSPSIISTEMTREVERALESIERGVVSVSDVIEKAATHLLTSLQELKVAEEELSSKVREATRASLAAADIIGECPVCKDGYLKIIRSKKSGKRFVGCTNYDGGCRTSAPLPQKGRIKSLNRRCKLCGWPMVAVILTRYPWRICVNPSCPTKKEEGKL